MDEKMTILKMVEDGKITADEAMKLIGAIDEKSEELNAAVPAGKSGAPKFVRIRILDEDSDRKTKVNVNLPISLVDVGLKIAQANSDKFGGGFNLNGVNLSIEEIGQMIKDGAEGKIVEVDSDDGTHVEIVVE